MKALKWLSLAVVITLTVTSCQQEGDTMFEKIAPKQSGLEFKNTLVETEEFNVLNYTYFYNGGGVAIGDVDNDGLPDIYLTGNMVASHLYINQGNFNFENRAAEAGVEAAGFWNTGVTMADVNDDGWLDIYVCRSAANSADARRNLLFINDGVDDNGQVSFTESAKLYGLDDQAYSTQATFFDFDRDGDLDMYLLNHSIPMYANFTADIEHLKKQENQLFSHKLYEQRDGKFVDISNEAGLVNNVLGFGLGVAVSDFNNDGWPDIYVSNDFNEEDYLYINQQDGTYEEQLRSRIDYTSLFSMGSDVGDVNNDGRTDILSLDMLPQDNYRIKLMSGADNFNKYQLLLDRNFYKQNMRNMLQLNQGNGRFKEVGQMAGISNSDWSWSALMSDYDLDGWPDIFVSNGYARDYTNMDFMNYAMNFKIENPDIRERDIPIEQMIEHMPEIAVANKIYKNEAGHGFADVSAEWGFVDPELSNGSAYGDLDGDGDLDLVINNVNQFASIYKNMAREKNSGHFLGIKPLVRQDAQPAIGTEVALYVGDLIMVRELYPSRGFQSSVEHMVHFGLGELTTVDSLIVHWPDGRSELFQIDSIDRYQTLIQGQGVKAVQRVLNKAENPFFTPDSVITYTHQENRFSDFGVQSLLPRFYSRTGPPMASGDLNGDGLTDVIIGGGSGQATQLFRGQPNGMLSPHSSARVFDEDAMYEDVAIAITDLDNDGSPDVLIASGGNHFPDGDGHYLLRSYFNDGRGNLVRNGDFPEVIRHSSVLLTGDFNGDGTIDILLGSAYKAQKYPLPGGNVILWNRPDGSWDLDADLPFGDFICMAAAWEDVDADGQSELILGGEWQPVEIWKYTGNQWEMTGRSPLKGLITALKVSDLDDDPEKEIVVGNWGENSSWKATPEEPLILYYGDFDNNGEIDPVLSYYIDGVSYPYVSRDDLTGQLSFLKKTFQSYHAYGEMNMQELLKQLPDHQSDSAQILSTHILDLVDGQWEVRSLPSHAQVAPVFVIETMDVDDDGDQDIILAGNSRYNRVKIGEIESNHGVLLRNMGQLKFQPVSPVESGLDLSGEVRSVLPVEINTEQKYLLFGINDGEVQTYRWEFQPVVN